jgi:hypothetical protein
MQLAKQIHDPWPYKKISIIGPCHVERVTRDRYSKHFSYKFARKKVYLVEILKSGIYKNIFGCRICHFNQQ